MAEDEASAAGPKDRRTKVLEKAKHWCKQAEPIFICGPARSGTSILTVSLAKHSQLFTPRGAAETFAFAKPRALREQNVRKGVKKYLGSPAAVKTFQELVADLDADGRLNDSNLIRLFFYFAGTKIYPGLRPLEKTPSHISHLDEIFDIFPNAKVIVSLRDPIEIVSSYRKRMKQEQEAGADRKVWGWLDKSAERLVGRFARITQHLIDAREGDADRIFVVPYSWVTADPASAFRELLAFLGLKYEDLIGGRAGSDEEPGKRLAEPISARRSESATYLTAEEIALIERETPAISESWRHGGILSKVRREITYPSLATSGDSDDDDGD